ncbi:MAG: TIM barrel protein [Caldilineaceae bacterium SB0668_bin_21]|nr:TIM barrel protein [Caldilineaceae bacterium SB0668_bin_21]MYC21768.1 TIM barrel protein [Caldilineaceae bacterium SB0662_bin_25]
MKVRIATAPVSWGVLMKDTPNVPPYSQVLDEIQEAGYVGTELGPYGYLPFDVPKLRDDLERRGLTLTSAFTIFNFLAGKDDETVYREALETAEVLAAMGCDYIVLSDVLFVVENRGGRAGRIRREDSLSDAEWDQAAENVNAFAKVVHEEYGMRCAAHPHVGGYLETDFEIDALLERTDSELVGLCFDMAHIAYGGGDPVAVLDKWRDRTWYLHIKECDGRVREEVIGRGGDYYDGVSSGVFPELGKGTVDWQGINRILHEMDFDGWGTVEQDILPGIGIDALASARGNRAFLRQELNW